MNGTVNLGFTIYAADFMHPYWFCCVSNYKNDLSSEMLCPCPYSTKQAWRLRELVEGAAGEARPLAASSMFLGLFPLVFSKVSRTSEQQLY